MVPLCIPPPLGSLKASHICIWAPLHCSLPTPSCSLDWKLLISLLGQKNPHPVSTTPRPFQTSTWRTALKLNIKHYGLLFCASSMTLHFGVMLGLCLPSQRRKAKCEGKIGAVGNSKQLLLHMASCHHRVAQGRSPLTFEPALLQVGLYHLTWQLFLVFSSRNENPDTGLFRFL